MKFFPLLKQWTSMVACVALTLTTTLISCTEDDSGPGKPKITTGVITDKTPSSATVSGTIISDGGSLITASGLAYSTTNDAPTIDDDTTKTAVINGSFTSRLKELLSNSTYYVRAYATNKAGTSYGKMVSFETGNEAPVAQNVTINGTIMGYEEVNVTYSYFDKEGDPQSGTTIQWYRADNASGLNTVAIADATSADYVISDDDTDKVLWVEVTPKASAGTQLGIPTPSAKTSAIGAATSVTFMYNNQEVTYGIIDSEVTGKRWMDRNLGAPNAPSVYNDYANFGDLFQWGRDTDGHQLINRTPAAGNPLSGTSTAVITTNSTTLSTGDDPGHNNFIVVSASPFDWRATLNVNLWQDVNGINNPCPAGWRIPTIDEWTAEQLGVNTDASTTRLKINNTGYRMNNGTFSATNSSAFYWSSTIDGTDNTKVQAFVRASITAPITGSYTHANAMAVRCIRD